MTDPRYTALMLVIDRSGSMMGIRDDMVGGLQQLINEQRALPGMLTVDVFSFDNQVEHVYSMAAPESVVITLDPRGGTALYDAIGVSIQVFGQQLSALPEHARPSTVQVAIVTDGQENGSREYTAAAVRELITKQTETYAWDFLFLGANQDAVLTARELGINADSALTYGADANKVGSMTRSTSRYMRDVRGKSKLGFTTGERDEAAD
jgi:uncharacterized protein YegL